MNLFTLPTPPIDGETYDPAKDGQRLGKLLDRVYQFMLDRRWHTLSEIQAACGGSESSVSARLRDLRKDKFGGHTIERQRRDGGLWVYRMPIKDPRECPVCGDTEGEIGHHYPLDVTLGELIKCADCGKVVCPVCLDRRDCCDHPEAPHE